MLGLGAVFRRVGLHGRRCRSLSCPVLLAFLLFATTRGPAQPGNASTKSSQNAEADFARLQAAERSAIAAGDAAAVEGATRALASFALAAMADLRAEQHLYPASLELYKRALALEESGDVRRRLQEAEQRAGKASTGKASRRASSGQNSDPSVRPSKAQLAAFSAQEITRWQSREDKLRQILSVAFTDWGTAEARQARYAESLVYFHEAEDWDASTPGLLRSMGIAAFRSERYEEAARSLQLAVLRDPHDAHSRVLLGMAYFSLNRFAQAIHAFAASGEEALQDPRASYAYAFSLARTGRQNEANALVDRLSALELPSDQMALVCKIYDATENYEHAASCFRRLSQKDERFPGAHAEAGAALIRLDRPNDAIPDLQAELRLNANDLDAQYYLAFAYLQLSRKDEAKAMLTAIVAADASHLQAQYQLGKLLLDEGKTDESIRHLEIAAQGDKTHDYLHYQLQAAYRRAGRTADANRELELYKEIKAKHREAAAPRTDAVPTP